MKNEKLHNFEWGVRFLEIIKKLLELMIIVEEKENGQFGQWSRNYVEYSWQQGTKASWTYGFEVEWMCFFEISNSCFGV